MSLKLKKIVSGIQPSGILHLGNYLGAIKNWTNLQNIENNKCYFFIADNHSATTKFSSENFEENIIPNKSIDLITNLNSLTKLDQLSIATAACILACGVNPKKVILFNQSNIPAHSELMWILSSMTPLSWLNKMIQFKEKSKNNKNDISSTGLYTYPILMAADILIYKADEVPVGDDQIQHIELCRDIAQRLNKIAKRNILPLPNYITNSTSRVMSLQNGITKMSKSDKNTHSCLSLITTEDEIKMKITKAKTDSLGKLTFDVKNRPDVSNLINIYSQIENLSIEEVILKFENASTFEFKQELIKSLIDVLIPISYKAKVLIEKDFDYVRDVLREGKKIANEEANRNLNEIKMSLNYFL